MTRKDVEKALFEMGVPSNTKPFDRIVDIIIMMYERDWNGFSLMAAYEEIAERDFITVMCVERGIRNTFSNVRKKPDSMI